MINQEFEHITPPFPPSEMPELKAKSSETAAGTGEALLETPQNTGVLPEVAPSLETPEENRSAPEAQDEKYAQALRNLEQMINGGANPADFKIGSNPDKGEISASMLNDAVYGNGGRTDHGNADGNGANSGNGGKKNT